MDKGRSSQVEPPPNRNLKGEEYIFDTTYTIAHITYSWDYQLFSLITLASSTIYLPRVSLDLEGDYIPSLYFSCPLGAEMYIHPSSVSHPMQYRLATTCLPVL